MIRLSLILCLWTAFDAISQANCNENLFNTNITYNYVSDNSGNTYRTVVIGGREWFAENLRTNHYLNGDTITEVSSINPDENLLKNGAWSYYNDSAELDCSRGKLYNFYTIVDERGLCPSGFRVPSFYDWEQLIQSIGGPANGLDLMEVGGTHWTSANLGATNSTGFTAVPAGVIDGNGDLEQLESETYWWTASFGINTINQYTSQNFFTKRLGSSDGYLYQLGDPTFRNLHSIRCVQVDTGVNHQPILSPLVIDSVGLYSVYITSDITNDGGLPLRVRGIVVGTDSTVTLNTSHRIMDGASLGSVSSAVTNLEPNTTYYARLYAGNDDEIIFGDPVPFTTQTVQLSLPAYIPATGNKGYWPFNGNANDESGNQRHGVVYGPQLTSDRFGNPASAYNFDSLLYISTSFNNLNSPTMTLAAWARVTSSQPEQAIASTSEGYSGLFFNSDQITATFSTGGGFHNGDYPNSACNDGNWHHVAMSYNDTTIRVYLDGEMVVDGPISFDLLFGGTLEFGRHNPFGRYFHGDLDDIGLWDRALSPTEIYQLYQAQCTLSVAIQPVTTVNCEGDTIALTASANATCQYQWFKDGQLNPAAPVSVYFANQSGTYTVKTLSGVCVSYDSLTISMNPIPFVNAGADQNICIGAPVTLTGNGANTYSWDNGVQNAVAFFPNGSMTYVVVGTDMNGCTAQDTVQVGVGNYTLPVISTTPSDQGICNGAATVQTDPTGSFVINWSNGVQGVMASGLCSGLVSVIVTETTYGCVYQSYEFVEETGMVFPLSTQLSLSDASTDGLCDGAATFFAYGGVSPYTYEIVDGNNNMIGSNPTISGLCSGIYMVYVSDSQGAIDSTSFYIADPSNVYSSNPYSDSTITDTLFVDLLEDCTIDFATIDSAWISQISYPNADTAAVIWAIQDINGIHYLNRDYVVTNLLGTFAIELVLFCPAKAPGDPYFKLYNQVYIDAQTLDVDPITGFQSKVILFPNPTNDLIMLLGIDGSEEDFFLIDSQGRSVLEGKLNGSKTLISLSTLSSGTYMLRIGQSEAPLMVIKQ